MDPKQEYELIQQTDYWWRIALLNYDYIMEYLLSRKLRNAEVVFILIPKQCESFKDTVIESLRTVGEIKIKIL